MKPRAGDFFIAALIILSAAAILIYPYIKKQPAASRVEITRAGGEVLTFSCADERELSIDGCEIKIADGGVEVKAADCPDQVCVNTGKITRRGQSIICVPNRVSIQITGEGDYDVLAG